MPEDQFHGDIRKYEMFAQKLQTSRGFGKDFKLD